jgi:hypothetical protein
MHRGDENARAAGLAPHTFISATGFGPIVIPRIEFSVVYQQFALKQMQLFDSRMAVGRIIGSWSETH